MPLHINNQGTWEEVEKADFAINDQGTWKEPVQAWVNDQGTWKEIFETATDLTYEDQGTIFRDDTFGTTDTGDVDLPTFASGDLLVLVVVISSNTIGQELLETPSGWDRAVGSLGCGDKTGSNPYVNIYTRISDGTEGTDVTITRTSEGGSTRTWAVCFSFSNPNTTSDEPYEPTANIYAHSSETGIVSSNTYNKADYDVFRHPAHRFGGSGLTLRVAAWVDPSTSATTFPSIYDPMGTFQGDTNLVDDEWFPAGSSKMKVYISLIDHISGDGETYTNLITGQRAWESDVGPATPGSAWTKSLVTIFDADTVSGYEHPAFVMLDSAGTGRHGCEQDFSVTSGEEYYIYFCVACRTNTGASAADQIRGCVITVDDGTTELGQGFLLARNVSDSAEVVSSQLDGAFDEAYIAPGFDRVSHIFLKYTAAITGTVTLGFYQSTVSSGEPVLSRAAAPTNTGSGSDEWIENGIELIQAYVGTTPYLNPRDFRREDIIRLGNGIPGDAGGFTGDTGASLPASEHILLPRYLFFDSAVSVELMPTTVCLTLRNNTEDLEGSPSAWLVDHYDMNHFLDSSEYDLLVPHAIAHPRFIDPVNYEFPVKLALPRRSGKWYWEILMVRNSVSFPGGSGPIEPNAYFGLCRHDYTGNLSTNPDSARQGAYGILPAGFAYQNNSTTGITFPDPVSGGDLGSGDYLAFAWDADNGTLDVYQGNSVGVSADQIDLTGLPGGGLLQAGDYDTDSWYVPYYGSESDYYIFCVQTNRGNARNYQWFGDDFEGSFLEMGGGTIPSGFEWIGAGAPEDDETFP